MRAYLAAFCLLVLASAALAQTPPPPAPAQPRIYTGLPSDVPPEVRNARTFVPVRVISEQFGARVEWHASDRTIWLYRAASPAIRLAIGSTSAMVGEAAVTLDAAPYVTQGRTMVPLRFIAETYDIPVAYQVATRDVLLYRGDRVYVLPLPSFASGIRIADPPRNTLVRTPILVQGVANVYEGALIIEVRDSGGRVLGRTLATAGMGGYYPFSTRIYYNLPSEDPSQGRVVVYSQDGRGDNRILAEDSVPVTLASTI